MTKRCFFYIKCVLFVLVLSISGEISAQEKRDSVRIYFHQGKVNIDTCLLDNGNEMERFAKICSALNDSVRLIRKIQIIGGASPEGGGLLNGRLSEKRAEVLWRYISPYIKIPVLEKDFHFSGSDWNGLITMVRADVNVPEREDVLRLLEKIVRLENQDSPYLGGELKRLKGGRPYSYLYKFHFPKLRSSMVKICYDSDPINPVRDTVYIHTRDTLCIRDTVTVIAPVKKRPFCMAVKTNLLYDAVLIPDIGVEFCLGKNWSVAGIGCMPGGKVIGSIIIGVSMGEMWSCAAGSVGERWKNRFPGIMSDCTGRSSPMISNWVGKVTWGINGVTGEAWLTATRYLWDIGSMWISRWESATLEDRTRSTSLWTVTMYGRPLKTAAGSARPRRVSLWCG